MRVLIAEATGKGHQTLVHHLRHVGADVDTVDSGEDLLSHLRFYDYDAAVLDTGLTDMNGLEALRRLRAAAHSIPVIMLGLYADVSDSILAFHRGADDFVRGFYDVLEVNARLQAVSRRARGHAQAKLTCGPVEVCPDTREVMVHGQPLTISGKEYAILSLLVLRKGSLITKERLMQHLYGGRDQPADKILDVFICKLRKKLAAAGAPSVIGTIWGGGFVARELSVSPREASCTPAPATASVPA